MRSKAVYSYTLTTNYSGFSRCEEDEERSKRSKLQILCGIAYIRLATVSTDERVRNKWNLIHSHYLIGMFESRISYSLSSSQSIATNDDRRRHAIIPEVTV